MIGFEISCDLVPDMEFFETPQSFKDAIRKLNITTKESSEYGAAKVTKQPAESVILGDVKLVRDARVFKGHNA